MKNSEKESSFCFEGVVIQNIKVFKSYNSNN